MQEISQKFHTWYKHILLHGGSPGTPRVVEVLQRPQGVHEQKEVGDPQSNRTNARFLLTLPEHTYRVLHSPVHRLLAPSCHGHVRPEPKLRLGRLEGSARGQHQFERGFQTPRQGRIWAALKALLEVTLNSYEAAAALQREDGVLQTDERKLHVCHE